MKSSPRKGRRTAGGGLSEKTTEEITGGLKAEERGEGHSRTGPYWSWLEEGKIKPGEESERKSRHRA